ncbi:MAG: DNA-processing protein DprA [Neisseriaceae bacterium]|nr:DNA-processing protein DprA [Neisseriaceae bacterium]MCV2508995.1 DNA-processing protein DprA [Neisseriaceae bacterium]
MPMTLTDSELKDYLTVAFTPHLGSISFLNLMKEFDTPSQVLKTPFDRLKPFLEKPHLVLKNWLNPDVIEKYVLPAMQWQNKNENCTIVTLYDSLYPIELSEVYPSPPVLFLRGDKTLLKKQKIAIVGSRSPTPQGLNIAKHTAQEISRNDFCIVSGMALGIDAAAHEGALLGAGSTIAILGTGIDLVYPKANYELAHKIAEKGLIISEFPIGTKANAINFPIRNRIIAGLSLTTVVVEATLKSGSLITARLAMEQGKDVMAFPGSIYNAQSKGSHRLIKDGAKLVESAQEILEDFHKSDYNETKHNHEMVHQEASNNELVNKVLEIMGSQIIHPDEISNIIHLQAEEVHSILLMLELEGTIQKTSGGRFQRVVF